MFKFRIHAKEAVVGWAHARRGTPASATGRLHADNTADTTDDTADTVGTADTSNAAATVVPALPALPALRARRALSA
ncbi:hypothetical protein ABZX65_11860 [Streptomyces sp. NPDC003300]|uniref:hypothetical protein n=1 Tax=unclassified Streptomyces TaxID=2593676 RepID=UPI0033A31BE4